MPRLDDSRMNRAHGDLVDLVALDAIEIHDADGRMTIAQRLASRDVLIAGWCGLRKPPNPAARTRRLATCGDVQRPSQVAAESHRLEPRMSNRLIRVLLGDFALEEMDLHALRGHGWKCAVLQLRPRQQKRCALF